MRIQAFLSLSLLTLSSSLPAHEYWLDPIDSSVARGDSAIVDIRNGQSFSGPAFPYDESQYQTITVNNPSGSETYVGRLGDYPAIHPQLNTDGLHSINVDTNPKRLTYKTWEQFNTFLNYHGLHTIKDRHQERELPTTDINESYVRSAKTLLQVNSTGSLNLDNSTSVDISNHKAFSASGSIFEMLLLDNPYSKTETVRIKLLYQSKPLSKRQVEMFWKGSTLIRLTAITDDAGIATFKLLGEGDYLLNSVKVAEPENDDAHWLSYWASITFER